MNNPDQQEVIDHLKYRISDEGLDYTFQCYSKWEELKDEKFHKLRQNYLDAASELMEYINSLEGSEEAKEE